MWQPMLAQDLVKGDVFLYDDEYEPSQAHVVSTPVTEHLDAWVKFGTHLKWSDRAEGPDVVEGNTPVHKLVCTCNGMGFICNRWVYTGECRCVHISRPKES